MRSLRLSGREAALIRGIGFNDSISSAELLQVSSMELDEFLATVNALLASGVIETLPFREHVSADDLGQISMEVNPACNFELRQALSKR